MDSPRTIFCSIFPPATTLNVMSSMKGLAAAARYRVGDGGEPQTLFRASEWRDGETASVRPHHPKSSPRSAIRVGHAPSLPMCVTFRMPAMPMLEVSAFSKAMSAARVRATMP